MPIEAAYHQRIKFRPDREFDIGDWLDLTLSSFVRQLDSITHGQTIAIIGRTSSGAPPELSPANRWKRKLLSASKVLQNLIRKMAHQRKANILATPRLKLTFPP